MTHGDFMRAIRAAPDDDGPRLVYADWLEENGEPARAEFIRVQCARARLPAGDARAGDLNGRAQALLAENWEAWVGLLRRVAGRSAGLTGETWILGDYHPDGRWRFRRGFVEELSLTPDVLLEHADELFGVAPLRRLNLWRAGPSVPALARLPHLAGVEALEFSDPWDNLVRADGMAALAASPHLRRLTSLNLSRNDIADAGAAALAGAPWLAGLRALNLVENGLSDAGAEALAVSPRVSGLHSLELGRNGITDRGLGALARSPHLANLRVLGLDRNFIGPSAGAVLATSACLSRCEVKLDFQQPTALSPGPTLDH
jgi:uncharacterized protein (TIGR02996 family)